MRVSDLPTTVPLTIYQRSALAGFLQIADDAVTILGHLLRIARVSRRPLYFSSLTDADCACGQAACAGLRELLRCTQPWVGGTPAPRWRFLVREHLREAERMLALVVEATPDRQRRQVLAELLTGLSDLQQHIRPAEVSEADGAYDDAQAR